MAAYSEPVFSDSFRVFGVASKPNMVLQETEWDLVKESESETEVAQSGPTLCNPMDYNLPGSPVHGILQARILEWVAISFSRRPSQPRDWTQVSRTVGRCNLSY